MSDGKPKKPRKPIPSPPIAVAAVLLFSKDPERLARFYREELGVPLRCFRLKDLPVHWACDIRHVYVSIWPAEGVDDGPGEALRGGLALYVRDVKREFDRLVAGGVRVELSPRTTPLGILARLRDPDGNPSELYQPLPRLVA